MFRLKSHKREYLWRVDEKDAKDERDAKDENMQKTKKMQTMNKMQKTTLQTKPL